MLTTVVQNKWRRKSLTYHLTSKQNWKHIKSSCDPGWKMMITLCHKWGNTRSSTRAWHTLTMIIDQIIEIVHPYRVLLGGYFDLSEGPPYDWVCCILKVSLPGLDSLALESRGWACEPLPLQISTNCSLVAFLGFDRREARGNEYVMISIYLLGTDCWKCSSLRGFTRYLPSTNCQSAANCMALICGNEKHHSKETITYRQTESFVAIGWWRCHIRFQIEDEITFRIFDAVALLGTFYEKQTNGLNMCVIKVYCPFSISIRVKMAKSYIAIHQSPIAVIESETGYR